MLEPADSQEARDFTMRAFALSEEFDTPVHAPQRDEALARQGAGGVPADEAHRR